MAVVAALQVAEREGPDAVVVVLLPDGGRGYMAKIFNDKWMSSYGFLRSTSTARPRVSRQARCCGERAGSCPTWHSTHPSETLRDAIEILREYGVSQMPVVGAEPPVMAGEVAGAVTERDLLSAVFEGAPTSPTWCRRTWANHSLIGSGEPVSAATKALSESDALMVVDDGKTRRRHHPPRPARLRQHTPFRRIGLPQ